VSRSKITRLILATVFAAASAVPIARAQSAPETSNREIRTAIESDVRTVVSRYLPQEAYTVRATYTPATAATESLNTYLPDSVPSFVSGVPGSWIASTSAVTIEIAFQARYDAATRQEIVTIVEQSLGLIPTRGDRVTATDLRIALPNPTAERELAILRAEAAERAARAEVETVRQSRDDAARDLALAKAELERVARTTQADQKADAAASQPAASTPDPFAKILGETLASLSSLAPWAIGGLIAILLVAIAFGGLTLRTAASTLGGAIRAIAESLPQLGEKIGSASAGGRDSNNDSLPAREELAALPPARDAMHSASPLAGVPLEAAHALVLKIHEELRATFTKRRDTAESIILRRVTQLLADDAPESTGKAVVTLELMGREIANALYQKLGVDEQQAVFNFLERGTHTRPKVELLLEVGEELKTRLFCRRNARRARPGPCEPRKQAHKTSRHGTCGLFGESRPRASATPSSLYEPR